MRGSAGVDPPPAADFGVALSPRDNTGSLMSAALVAATSRVDQHLNEHRQTPPRGDSLSPRDGSMGRSDLPAAAGTSRVDRLLRERIRKTQSQSLAFEGLSEAGDLLEADEPEREEHQRLILIANRLPVTAVRDGNSWKLQPSSGGLASAMLNLDNFNITWIGWPGIFVPEGRDRDLLTRALLAEGYHPVYLDESAVDLYYNGFCNQVLWQLFHYVPLNLDSKLSETRTLQMQWKAYQDVNKAFADVALQIYQEGDVVWCQDYHLMLLPELLKKAHRNMKVGWFLHTPFPSSEIYRTLPVREEVLRATLKADLIGFHTYDYARHFVSACTRILGFEFSAQGTPEGVEDNGQLTRVAAFPIGIEPERFTNALNMPEVKSNIAGLLKRYAGRKVMLGVDRLDMIKGIPQKLLAYEKFLEEHPEWRDKVLLVQIAVPSRMDVPEYQQLRSLVHEIVGRINGKYGTLTHVPIHHLDRSLNFKELCALYAITDVALITSLRDGMNLVSYEYVACQSDGAGVLVLSEFAGAAQSLGAGAILVNPWNITDMAAAIRDALTMSDEERRQRHRQNYMHVTIHTAQTWADTFVSELNDTHVENEMRIRWIPPELPCSQASKDFLMAKGRRLLVLGYNATLTQLVEAPRQPKRHFDQIKAHSSVNPDVYDCVCKLAAHPLVTVMIFSGTDRFKLCETFGNTPNIWLAAENGVFVRPPLDEVDGGSISESDEWVMTVPNINKDWRDSVQLVFEYFSERTPRSFVEVRESSLVWNYKYADVEFGRVQARDLLQHLWTGPISNAPVDIVQGARSVEARPVSVSKGASMARIMALMAERGIGQGFEYVLCMGHFLGRDENLFSFFEGKGLGPAAKDQHLAGPVTGATSSAEQRRTKHRWPTDPGLGPKSHLEEESGEPPVPPCSSSSLLVNMMRARALGKPSSASNPTAPSASHWIPEGYGEAKKDDGFDSIASHEVEVSPRDLGNETSSSGAPFAQSLTPGCLAMHTTASGDETNPPPVTIRQPKTMPVKTKSLAGSNGPGYSSRALADGTSWDLPPQFLYTCTVGRSESQARYSLTGSKEVALLLQELVDLIPLLPPTDSPLQESSSALTSPARNPNAIMIPASGNQERSANGHRSPLHRQMGTNKAKRQLFPTFSL